MWCLAARGLAKGRAHPGPPTPCRVASECMDTPEVERMTSLELVAPITHDSWRGRALPTELHPQNLRGNPSVSTEVASQQVVKERPPSPVVRSIDRGSAPMRRPVEVRNEKGPDPFGIRASAYRELGGCATTRCPLPDAFGPRSDQAASHQWMARIGSSSDRPDARRRRVRPATPSPRRARTRPDP